jgi:MFS transporter, CP family, cyanate transporter
VIPPVLPLLHAEFHLSETEVGWLSSLPPMMFAIAAIPGALLIARLGIVPAVLVGLLLNAAGAAARGAIPQTWFLYLSTIVMAGGVSIMQPAMPPLVRNWFPSRVGFATAVYTNGLLVGEIIVVGLTIPVVLPLLHGSWRLNFVFWAIPVLVTALLMIAVVPGRSSGRSMPMVSRPRRWWPDWSDPLIWRLGIILGSVNTSYFVTNAFLPDYLHAVGRPDLVSASLTSLNLCQLPASLLMLSLAGRLVKSPWAYVVNGGLCLLSLIGMMVMKGAWIVAWAGLLGFANAVILILVLALPSILGKPEDVPRISAGMFTVSYSLAMAISVLGGWLWDETHLPIAGFAPVAMCVIVVMALASTVRRAERYPLPGTQ